LVTLQLGLSYMTSGAPNRKCRFAKLG
jgi:hypothetical protein